MAQDANGIFLVGRLTADAESKEIGDNTVTNFRLAFSTREKQNGEWGERSNFVGCSLWGSAGVVPYLTKGRQVAVTGSLVWREWGEGDKRRSVNEIRVRDLQLLAEGKGGGGAKASGDLGGELPGDWGSVASKPVADDSIPF